MTVRGVPVGPQLPLCGPFEEVQPVPQRRHRLPLAGHGRLLVEHLAQRGDGRGGDGIVQRHGWRGPGVQIPRERGLALGCVWLGHGSHSPMRCETVAAEATGAAAASCRVSSDRPRVSTPKKNTVAVATSQHPAMNTNTAT